MGATGSAYFKQWISDDTQDKYSALEEKIMALETRTIQMTTTISEMTTRIDTVEKRASTMIFQEEPDCDIVIIS
jgi:predicted  nucleic acid-binding Zn-ribbon protein